MPGLIHPIDDVVVDAADVAKGDLRSFVRDRTEVVMENVAEIQATDLSGQKAIVLLTTGRSYKLDATDTTTPDDGQDCIRDANGLAFKIVITTAASDNGGGLFYDTLTDALADVQTTDTVFSTAGHSTKGKGNGLYVQHHPAPAVITPKYAQAANGRYYERMGREVWSPEDVGAISTGPDDTITDHTTPLLKLPELYEEHQVPFVFGPNRYNLSDTLRFANPLLTASFAGPSLCGVPGVTSIYAQDGITGQLIDARGPPPVGTDPGSFYLQGGGINDIILDMAGADATCDAVRIIGWARGIFNNFTIRNGGRHALRFEADLDYSDNVDRSASQRLIFNNLQIERINGVGIIDVHFMCNPQLRLIGLQTTLCFGGGIWSRSKSLKIDACSLGYSGYLEDGLGGYTANPGGAIGLQMGASGDAVLLGADIRSLELESSLTTNMSFDNVHNVELFKIDSISGSLGEATPPNHIYIGGVSGSSVAGIHGHGFDFRSAVAGDQTCFVVGDTTNVYDLRFTGVRKTGAAAGSLATHAGMSGAATTHKYYIEQYDGTVLLDDH